MKFEVRVDERAIEDTIKAMTYYEEQKVGLGDSFAEVVERNLEHLTNSAHFQIKYKTIRTLPLKPFPFMIHFTLDETTNVVKIHAIIHTSLDPKKNWL